MLQSVVPGTAAPEDQPGSCLSSSLHTKKEMFWRFYVCVYLMGFYFNKDCLGNISEDFSAILNCSDSRCSSNNKSQLELPNSYSVRKCYCDEDCHIFQDCCPELVTGAKKLDSRTLHKNVSLAHWGCGNLTPTSKIYMIKSCPANHPLSKLCSQKDIKDADYDYKLDVPVLSNRYNIWYQNIFCAICHKEEEYLAPLILNFNCTGNLTLPQVTSNGTYVPKEMKWTMPGSRDFCRFSSKVNVGNVGAKINQTGWIRQCVTMEHVCASDWRDSQVAELCQSYAYFVYKLEGNQRQIFKNPHCAICNHKSVKDLKCWHAYENKSRAVRLPSLSIVLDLNLSGADDKCSDNYLYEHSFYDPLHEKCVPVTCSKHSEYRDGDCVPINGESINVHGTPSRANILNSCPLITLSPWEYQNLSNGIQLILNTSNETIPAWEYEILENGFVRICNTYKLSIPYSSDVFKGYISTICISISIMCLILHDIIFLLLPNMQNLPAKNLFALTTSLLLAQTIFLTGIYPLSEVSHGVCIGIAVLIHYFFLSAFFWMNVMSIDIWKTFSGRRLSIGSKNSHWKYAIYAWCSPAALVLISVGLDNTPNFPSAYRPHYALHRMTCWFGNPTGLLIFFTVPMILLITVNVILFGITIFKIYETSESVQYIKKKTKAEFLQASKKYNLQENEQVVIRHPPASSVGISGKRDKVRFYLYVKLFIIMGLTWISGMVAIFAHIEALWYAFVILNGLQGAFIFFMFDFKWKIATMMWERLARCLTERPNFVTSGSRDRTTTTSTRISESGQGKSGSSRYNSTVNEEPDAGMSGNRTVQASLCPEEEPLRKRSTFNQIMENSCPISSNLKDVSRSITNIGECCGVVK